MTGQAEKKSTRTIVSHIITGYGLILLLSAISGLMTLSSLQRLHSITNDLYVHPFTVSNAGLETRLTIAKLRNRMLQIAITRDRKEMEQLSAETLALGKELRGQISLVKRGFLGDKNRVVEAERLAVEWEQFRLRVIELAKAGRKQEAEQLVLTKGADIFGQISSIMDYVIESARAKAKFFAGEAEREAAAKIRQAVALLAGLALVIGISGWIVTRRIIATIRGEEQQRAAAEHELRASESRFRQVVSSNAVAFMFWSYDGSIWDANDHFLGLLGYTRNDMTGGLLNWRYLTPPGWEKADAEAVRQLEERGVAAPFEKEYLHRDGHLVPILLSCAVFVDMPGKGVSIIIDQSAAKKARTDQQLAASVFHHTIEGIVITNANAEIISVNQAFTDITGYTADEVIGKKPSILKSDRHDAAFFRELWEKLIKTGLWQGEIWNRRKNGDAYPGWLTISMIPDPQGRPLHYVSVFSDITEIQLKEQHIKHMAFHDALTGLPNRFLLKDRLEHEIDIARRDRSVLGLMFLDLDRFKVVNDSLGHEVGDQLLKAVADRLSAGVRKSDTVARLGGDEFVIILNDIATTLEAAHVAEKLINLMSEGLEISGHILNPSVSIGISLFPQDGDDVGTLMKQADTAMYSAKSGGRSTFRFFDPSMNHHAVERLDMEADMRRALENREFEVYYQPKLCLTGNFTCGAEALIRWKHPEKGLLLPDDFIPLAEETGLILQMGDWVLAEVCRQIGEWLRKGVRIGRVAVNLSARQFQDKHLLERIGRILEETGVSPGMLEIELTESTVMNDPNQGIGVMQGLSDLGIHLSVDDFGTGYSSLANLRRLPIQSLKIDRSFISDLEKDPNGAAIIRTIIALGQTLKLGVIAEGVETSGQMNFLRKHGCTHAQGYYHARPMPALLLEKWLATAESGTPQPDSAVIRVVGAEAGSAQIPG